MGRKKKAPKPPTPVAPPPPVEEVEAEFISPAIRRRSAERARRGAYITKGERKLGGRAKPLSKDVIEARKGEVEGVDLLKGFKAPERKSGVSKRPGRRATRWVESDEDLAKRTLDAKVDYLQEKGKGFKLEKVKTAEQVDPYNTEIINRVGRQQRGKRNVAYKKAVKRRKANYDAYLRKWVSRSSKKVKYQDKTTRLKNLGLM